MYCIVGGGVVGLTLARALKQRAPACSITLLEKEATVGMHTSGRNSGVLHAGFYYKTDSQKAKFCVEGNRRWHEYCKKRNLPIRETGKIVTCKKGDDPAHLHALYDQGMTNGVDLKMITHREALSIEPTLVGSGDSCIWSPNTAVMDTTAAMQSLREELVDAGVEFKSNTQFLSMENNKIQTNQGVIEADYIINCAGLDALDIAQGMGHAQHLTMVPFKGRYAISTQPVTGLKALVYPVPQPGAFVLGVHSTLTTTGYVKIGPTVFPAFGKENYDWLQGVSPQSLGKAIKDYSRLLFSKENKLISHFIKHELHKSMSLAKIIQDAGELQNFGDTEFKWYRSGIRPQMFDTERGQLVNDFLYYKDSRSLHLLNVVSPGWTCAMPLADWICDSLIE